MTVNYLGHFESREFFGCNAGHKMVYVDACGEVSPCVFTPMTFGNLHDRPLAEIFAGMKSHFPADSDCFINKNYRLLGAAGGGRGFLDAAESLRVMHRSRIRAAARFFPPLPPRQKGEKSMKDQALRLYRLASLAMAAIFAAVGLLFLFLPGPGPGSLQPTLSADWASPRPRSRPEAFIRSWASPTCTWSRCWPG